MSLSLTLLFPSLFIHSSSLYLVKGNLRSWLLDENCYDQCSVIYNQGGQVAIAQCTPQELKVVTEREVCLEVYFKKEILWFQVGNLIVSIVLESWC